MIKIQAKHGIVMDNPNSLFSYFGWPSVTRLPDGTLAATASGFRMAHMCPFGKSVISYSRDEGETWTRPAVLIDTLLDDRDTGIACIGGNRVMVTSFNNKLEQQRVWADQNYAVNTKLGSAARAFKQAYCDLAAATGDTTLRMVDKGYLGEHAGMTAEEMTIPLIAVSKP